MRVVARVVVFDRNGAILLVRYNDGRPGRPAHYWAAPGGALEPGETHHNAAQRELLEETGLEAEVGRELWSRRALLDLPAGMIEQDERYFLVQLAEAAPVVRNTSPEEIVGHRWWPLSELGTTAEVVFPEGLLLFLAEAGFDCTTQHANAAVGQVRVSMIRGVAAFDLDGTLLRGDTVCEVLAKRLGRLEEMKRFEAFTSESDIAEGRERMATWYRDHTVDDLQSHLRNACWAPGAHEAIQQLQEAQVVVGIASITWKFAVRWFAERLNVRDCLGTDVSPNGDILHVWGRDKARWLEELAKAHGIPQNRIAAVGDSGGDAEMLRAAGLRFFVGPQLIPGIEPVIHLPGADLRVVSGHIISEWAPRGLS